MMFDDEKFDTDEDLEDGALLPLEEDEEEDELEDEDDESEDDALL